VARIAHASASSIKSRRVCCACAQAAPQELRSRYLEIGSVESHGGTLQHNMKSTTATETAHVIVFGQSEASFSRASGLGVKTVTAAMHQRSVIHKV
jgi:hypothetical protein